MASVIMKQLDCSRACCTHNPVRHVHASRIHSPVRHVHACRSALDVSGKSAGCSSKIWPGTGLPPFQAC